MDDVIAFMLEAEREAKERVEAAEAEAEQILRGAHQDAQEMAEKASAAAREQAAQLRTEKQKHAQQQHDHALAAYDTELDAIRARAAKRRDQAAEAAVRALIGGQPPPG